MSNPFVHDDVVFIQTNPAVENWSNLKDVFFPSAPVVSLPAANFYYRPLLDILYKIEFIFFAREPYGYHLFNLLVHIVNAILVCGLLRLLTGRAVMSLCAAVIFLVHPVQVEAVSSIVGISNLLFVFFGLCSLYLYVRHRQENGIPSGVCYAGSLVFLAAAILAKEQAVILVPLVFLVEYFFPVSQNIRQRLLPLLGFVAVTAGYFVFRAQLPGAGLVSGLWAYPKELLLRVLAVPQTLLMYLKILLWPAGLHYYRLIDVLRPFWGPVITLGALAAAFFFYARNTAPRKLLVFGLGWFLITLVPLSFLPLITEYSFVMASEHFLYFPMIGFLLMVLPAGDALAAKIFKDKKEIAAVLIFVLVTVGLMGISLRQNTYWRGEIPLFKRMLQFEKGFARGHNLLARAYYFNGEINRAVEEHKIALEIMGRYFRKARNAEARKFYLGFIKGIHFDLAHCYESTGEWAQAAVHYQSAIDIDPKDAVLHNNLGIVFIRMNRLDQASAEFRESLLQNPNHVMAMSNLAYCLIQAGQKEEAEQLLRRALSINPGFAPARQNLMRLLKESVLPRI